MEDPYGGTPMEHKVFNPYTAKILSSPAAILQLEHSVARLTPQHDFTAEPKFFLASISVQWSPRVVVVTRSGIDVGVVYAKERRVAGLPTGLLGIDGRLGNSVVADAADADDVLQDTVIALADALPFFRGDCSLFTFACAIAHRKVLTSFRSNARRARIALAASAAQPDSHQPPSSDNADVKLAFYRLSPEYREILALKYIEEISVAEIARVLAISEHAIESRLARARNALRKSLEKTR